jgi:glycosidase
MDMVLNHCSNEHKWFKEASKSRNSPYYNYFHWWPAEKGEPPYRFSIFDEKGMGGSLINRLILITCITSAIFNPT